MAYSIVLNNTAPVHAEAKVMAVAAAVPIGDDVQRLILAVRFYSLHVPGDGVVGHDGCGLAGGPIQREGSQQEGLDGWPIIQQNGIPTPEQSG